MTMGYPIRRSSPNKLKTKKKKKKKNKQKGLNFVRETTRPKRNVDAVDVTKLQKPNNPKLQQFRDEILSNKDGDDMFCGNAISMSMVRDVLTSGKFWGDRVLFRLCRCVTGVW